MVPDRRLCDRSRRTLLCDYPMAFAFALERSAPLLMTKRFFTTDLKGRLGYHEFQKVADLACPFCQKADLWLELIVEHLERSSASRAQRLYCQACEAYFERSPSGETAGYDVSDAFRVDFRKTAPFEPGDRPVRVQTNL